MKKNAKISKHKSSVSRRRVKIEIGRTFTSKQTNQRQRDKDNLYKVTQLCSSARNSIRFEQFYKTKNSISNSSDHNSTNQQ